MKWGSSYKWERWFAWRPVRLSQGSGKIVWLQYIERRYHPLINDYREIKNE